MSKKMQNKLDPWENVYYLALYIGPDKTVAEADRILKSLFNGENIISIDSDGYEIDEYGIHFVICHYAKDWKHILKVIEDIPGLEIDREVMSDWEVE